MKWLISFFVFLILATTLSLNQVVALECGDPPPSGDLGALNSYIDSCNQKISESKNQQTTLKQVISNLNSKISLAQAQINQTEAQIIGLEKDITVLSGVIDTVNISMDQLAALYITRVRESYKQLRTERLGRVFASSSLSQLLEAQRYLNAVKTKDEMILTELEKSRLDYDQQKINKQEKQKEVEKLQTKLITQKKDLDNQQTEKQRLLTTTQNDEKKFQSLLKQAQNEIAAIRRFVTSLGGATLLSNQTKCDDWGCYYSQRDSQWGNQLIGLSDMTLREVGCLITSTAMVASHYGKNLKPSDIASSSNPFFASTAYMLKGSWTVNGVTISRQDSVVSSSRIDEELNAGNPVIVGLYNGPAHFIVIRGKNDQGYIMNDPFLENGGNRQFSEKYNFSDITQLNIVRVY